MKIMKSKKIKKILSVVMAMCMLGALCIPSFAAELTDAAPTADVPVVYNAGKVVDDKGDTNPTNDVVEGSYTVTVPDYITVAKLGGTVSTEDVIASEVLLPFGKTLNVNVAFDTTLKLKDNAATTLTYDMQSNGAKIVSGATILSVAAGDPDATNTATIGAIATQAPLYAGVYTDTATFTTSVA